MNRRGFLHTVPLLLVASPLAGEAQPAGKVSRIMFLGASSAALESDRVGPFRQGLRDLGYIEGQNIVIEYRWAEGHYDRYPAFVAEAVSHKIDVIVTECTPAAIAARDGTRPIPHGDDRRSRGAIVTVRSQALVMPSHLALLSRREHIIDFATRRRLPGLYAYREFVEGGGLASYSPSYPAMLRRAAAYVDRILKGAKSGELPIEGPTKFDLVVNLKAAQTLGLTIPQSVLGRGDEIIQ